MKLDLIIIVVDQEEEEEEDSDTGDTGYERQKYDDLAAFIEHLSKNQNNKDTW